MNVLVVGGSSGLGLELAKKLTEDSHKVIATGRNAPKDSGLDIREFDLTQTDLPKAIDDFVKGLPPIDSLHYVAGLYPPWTITDLPPEQIDASLSVGGRGLMFFVRSLLVKQGKLAELMTVTSTVQYEPRKGLVVFNFVKAGEGHFSSGMAEDERVGKVLVVAPSVMREHDDAKADKDFLDKTWVAETIIEELDKDYRFRAIKLLHKPTRVEIVETR